ncbi:MAG: sulfide/dihydroorotate dehydrogenase-like FAD/NAD-binding protein [candidate division KSB1 bacterium]|nr:sulfide/dihydroorotate dehydrogenase-like FAD/NAD-binding protein [candidate division KSB1 bacterium]
MELNQIVGKQVLAPNVTRFEVYAPDIALKRRAGQFVIIRVNPRGERIPLTIADADSRAGTITLISQSVGKTTFELAEKQVGDKLEDVVGPLGSPTHIEKVGTVVSVGGGIGIAPLYPITQAMRAAGNYIVSILGARSKELLILEREMRSVSDEVLITTDDGTYGTKGFVTDALQEVIRRGRKIDLVIAIGPAVMMKMVSKLTATHGIPTVASLNTIMIDGTGMCGGCRVTVGGKTKFVCVDGPEFDAHQVDWDEMEKRLGMYKELECKALERYWAAKKTKA